MLIYEHLKCLEIYAGLIKTDVDPWGAAQCCVPTLDWVLVSDEG